MLSLYEIKDAEYHVSADFATVYVSPKIGSVGVLEVRVRDMNAGKEETFQFDQVTGELIRGFYGNQLYDGYQNGFKRAHAMLNLSGFLPLGVRVAPETYGL